MVEVDEGRKEAIRVRFRMGPKELPYAAFIYLNQNFQKIKCMFRLLSTDKTIAMDSIKQADTLEAQYHSVTTAKSNAHLVDSTSWLDSIN